MLVLHYADTWLHLTWNGPSFLWVFMRAILATFLVLVSGEWMVIGHLPLISGTWSQ